MKTKAEILSDDQELPSETIHVEAWGGEVTVCTLWSIDSDRMQQDWRKLGRPEGDYAGFSAWVVAHCVTNGDGKRVFDPATDLDALCRQPAPIIAMLFDCACKLNALTKADKEALVKN